MLHSDAAVDEMNRFLRSHRIVDFDTQFTNTKNGEYWTYSVKHLGKADESSSSNTTSLAVKVDYSKVLDAATFSRFSSLRIMRKKIADDEAVRAYIVFTDAELAEVAKLKEITVASLQTIHGVGEKRAEKYAVKMSETIPETSPIKA
ncbi:MAG: hypothetical protein RI894_882 [Bacteroidota bacterium]